MATRERVPSRQETQERRVGAALPSMYTAGANVGHPKAQRLGDRPDFHEWMDDVATKIEARREGAAPQSPAPDRRSRWLVRDRRSRWLARWGSAGFSR